MGKYMGTSKPKVPGSNPGWSVDFFSLTVVYVMCGKRLNLSRNVNFVTHTLFQM